MLVERLAAFSDAMQGGNPAGVVLCDALPEEAAMQAVAADVGYSETVFAARQGEAWRVRYFAPTMEVPFCGHATIALGAALARQRGDGHFALILNEGSITVTAEAQHPLMFAALQSPPTRSAPADDGLIEEACALYSLTRGDLDASLPPAVIEAGARHLLLALRDRQRLATIDYEFVAGAACMTRRALTTIDLVHAQSPRVFHSRNAFAAGGVKEDPATGAAAAAFAGYLRDRRWPHEGGIEILQGYDMGIPCRLRADIESTPGASIRVSGTVRSLGA